VKYPKEQYRVLLKAFIAVIKRKGYTIEEVRESYQFRCHPMKLGWDLFRMANAGLNGYGSLCDPVKSYATYPPGINDTHLKTAIKNILKDIGLWWEQGGEA
jgi:hypothetical protein